MSAPDFQTFWFQGSGGGSGARGDMWVTVIRNSDNDPANYGTDHPASLPGDLSFPTRGNILDKDDNIYVLGTMMQRFDDDEQQAAFPFFTKLDPNAKILWQTNYDSVDITAYPWPSMRVATPTPDGEIWYTCVDYRGTGSNGYADYNLVYGKINADGSFGPQGRFTFGDGYFTPAWMQTVPNPTTDRGWDLICCGRATQAGPGLAIKFDVENMGQFDSPGLWPQSYNTGTEYCAINDAGYTAYRFSGYLSPHPNTPATPSPNLMISTPDNTGTATKISSWTGNQYTNAYYVSPCKWDDQGFFYFCAKREYEQESQAPASNLQPNTLIRCSSTDAMPISQSNFKSNADYYNAVNNDYNCFSRQSLKVNPVTGEYWMLWSNSISTIDICKIDPFNWTVLDQKILRGIEVDGLLTCINGSYTANEINSNTNRYGGDVTWQFNSTGEYIIAWFLSANVGGNTCGVYRGTETGRRQNKYVLLKIPCDFEQMTGTCSEVGLQWEDTDYYYFGGENTGVFYQNGSALNGDLNQNATTAAEDFAYYDSWDFYDGEADPPLYNQQSYYYKG